MSSLTESINEKVSHAIEKMEARTGNLEEIVKAKIAEGMSQFQAAESEAVRGYATELETIQKSMKQL